MKIKEIKKNVAGDVLFIFYSNDGSCSKK